VAFISHGSDASLQVQEVRDIPRRQLRMETQASTVIRSECASQARPFGRFDLPMPRP
jgi:hypothetical protein